MSRVAEMLLRMAVRRAARLRSGEGQHVLELVRAAMIADGLELEESVEQTTTSGADRARAYRARLRARRVTGERDDRHAPSRAVTPNVTPNVTPSAPPKNPPDQNTLSVNSKTSECVSEIRIRTREANVTDSVTSRVTQNVTADVTLTRDAPLTDELRAIAEANYQVQDPKAAWEKFAAKRHGHVFASQEQLVAEWSSSCVSWRTVERQQRERARAGPGAKPPETPAQEQERLARERAREQEFLRERQRYEQHAVPAPANDLMAAIARRAR